MIKNFEKIFVLDTNIILQDAKYFLTLSQEGKNLIVIPETVIDEIDIKKTGFGEINYQAREFGRLLSEGEFENNEEFHFENEKGIVTYIKLKNTYIAIVSFFDYASFQCEGSIINDRKIIKTAKFIENYFNKNTILLSNDIMCRIRAISLNVKTESIKNNIDNLDFEFIKTLEINGNVNELEGIDIREIDSTYKPENYCYHFKYRSGERLGYIVNKKIKLIDDVYFRHNVIKPLNAGQLFAMAGMMDRDIDVVILDSKAGTGKSVIAVASGINLIKQGEYDKIIYIRNSVESVDEVEKVGFLPGLEEKFKIYNYPLYDSLDFIAQKSQRSQKDKKKGEHVPISQEETEARVKEIMNKYNIETMWVGAIRGRTISNAFVIVDEVQNCSKSTLLTILSRIDNDSKVVCIGSNRQIDHPYINKYTNGLSVLLKAAREDKNNGVNIFATSLSKVVRGKITEWAEKIFENQIK